MSRIIILILGFGFVMASVSETQSADKRPGAFIVSPKEGASVGRTSEFSGKTFFRGQPLALVRAVGDNGHWWVQRGIRRNDRGQLKGAIQFGNDLAEPGTRFAFVVVVVQTRLELEFFTKREWLVELPANVPKSEIRNVVLGRPGDDDPAEDEPSDDDRTDDERNAKHDAKPTDPPDQGNQPNDKLAAKPVEEPSNVGPFKNLPVGDTGESEKLGLAILKPLENAKVARFEELVGRMESDDAPVVLVRPAGADGQWWVQEKAVFGDGKYFKSKLRFGNGKTPAGTRFVVLVVSPTPGPEANAMKTGAAFSELPRGIRRSKEVIVQLGPPTMPEGAE